MKDKSKIILEFNRKIKKMVFKFTKLKSTAGILTESLTELKINVPSNTASKSIRNISSFHFFSKCLSI